MRAVRLIEERWDVWRWVIVMQLGIGNGMGRSGAVFLVVKVSLKFHNRTDSAYSSCLELTLFTVNS